MGLGLVAALVVLGGACASYPCTEQERAALGDRFLAQCDDDVARCDAELDAQRVDLMPEDAPARFAAANSALEGDCPIIADPNVTLCGTLSDVRNPRWALLDTAVNQAARVFASPQQMAAGRAGGSVRRSLRTGTAGSL